MVLLAALGLGVGSLVGRGPVQGSCGGMACIKDIACEGCQNRAREDQT